MAGVEGPTPFYQVSGPHPVILFATDFQVYNRLTLGSGGSGPPPTEDDALIFTDPDGHLSFQHYGLTYPVDIVISE